MPDDTNREEFTLDLNTTSYDKKMDDAIEKMGKLEKQAKVTDKVLQKGTHSNAGARSAAKESGAQAASTKYDRKIAAEKFAQLKAEIAKTKATELNKTPITEALVKPQQALAASIEKVIPHAMTAAEKSIVATIGKMGLGYSANKIQELAIMKANPSMDPAAVKSRFFGLNPGFTEEQWSKEHKPRTVESRSSQATPVVKLPKDDLLVPSASKYDPFAETKKLQTTTQPKVNEETFKKLVDEQNKISSAYKAGSEKIRGSSDMIAKAQQAVATSATQSATKQVAAAEKTSTASSASQHSAETASQQYIKQKQAETAAVTYSAEAKNAAEERVRKYTELSFTRDLSDNEKRLLRKAKYEARNIKSAESSAKAAQTSADRIARAAQKAAKEQEKSAARQAAAQAKVRAAYAKAHPTLAKLTGMQSIFTAGSQKAVSGMEKLKKSLYGITRFTIVIATLTRLAQKLGNIIKETMSYIETINFFNVTMGKASDSANKFITSLTKMSGLDPVELMKIQAIFNSLAKAIGVTTEKSNTMSEGLTQLAIDWASLRDMPVAEVAEKFQSGLVGLTKAVRTFGLDVSMAALQQEANLLGLDVNVDKLSQASKMQLRYSAMMRQSTVAMGDFARTAEQPANRLRILKEQLTQAARSLGSTLLPAINAILPYITAFLMVLQKVAATIAKWAGFNEMVAQAASNAVAAGSGMEYLSDEVQDTLESVDELSKSLEGLAGFDQLNILGSLGGTTTNAGLDIDIPIESYDSGLDDLITKAKELADKWSLVWDTPEGQQKIINFLENAKDFTKGFNDELSRLYNTYLKPIFKSLGDFDFTGTSTDFETLGKKVADLALAFMAIYGAFKAIAGLTSILTFFATLKTVFGGAATKVAEAGVTASSGGIFAFLASALLALKNALGLAVEELGIFMGAFGPFLAVAAAAVAGLAAIYDAFPALKAAAYGKTPEGGSIITNAATLDDQTRKIIEDTLLPTGGSQRYAATTPTTPTSKIQTTPAQKLQTSYTPPLDITVQIGNDQLDSYIVRKNATMRSRTNGAY